MESQQRYNATFEKNTAIKLIVDPVNGTIVDANSAAIEFYGCSCAQLKAMTIRVLSANPRHGFEFDGVALSHQRLAGGDIREVEVHSNPIILNGKTLQFLIIHPR